MTIHPSIPDDDSVLFEPTQFVVPRSAYGAIDVRAVIERCRREGFQRASVEANTKNAGGNKTRLTCRLFVAVRLAEAWSDRLQAADVNRDRELIRDCEAAMKAAANAVLQARDLYEHGGGTTGIRPAMG